MKPLFVSKIRKLINGELIQGSDDLLIMGVVRYLERMKSPNILLFLISNRKLIGM